MDGAHSLRNEILEEFLQLPSKTGKDVIDLEKYAKLPRTKAYEEINGFLEGARKSKEVKVLFIVAEWGEGKTSIYEGLLKKGEVIKSDLIIPVSTKRLITFIKERSCQFTDTGSIGIRLFACLLYAIKDTIESDYLENPPFDKIRIGFKRENESTNMFIKSGIESILSTIDLKSRLFVFLDEFEDIIDEDIEIQSFIISGLVEIINGSPRYLCQDPYAGRFHLLIAATPPAYERIASQAYQNIGRLFGQRVLKVELEKLDRKNTYRYILGILKYCWNGKLTKIPFCKPGMFNAIYLATLGNPRAIINVIELLLTQAKLRAPEQKIRRIDSELFVQILSGQKIQVYGGEVSILNHDSLSSLYRRIEQKCEKEDINKEKCVGLINLLLSSPAPLSDREIKKEMEIDEKQYPSYLRVIGESFNELWGIEPFIYMRKVIGEQDEVYRKMESKKEMLNLSKVVYALEFYEFDSDESSFVKSLFVPHQELARMSLENKSAFQSFIDFFTSLYPELRREDEIKLLVDRELFDKVIKSEEKYLMLSPAALNIFYPSPSVFFLDFVEDLDKRFKVGMMLMRNLVDFERQFCTGISYLLKEGSKNVRIIEGSERCELEEIDFVELIYPEIDRQYKVRACIFSPLKISEIEFHNRIERIADGMKMASIPLLLIFSWNPLPNEVVGILETFFGSKKPPEKLFYYMDFPLNTIQCHQLVGYIIAKELGYKIKEEKWKARALRILEEVKFENGLKKFIEEGIEKGYVTRPIQLDELKISEAPEILRTILITEGSLEERYKQIRWLEETFRIFGKDFPICPKDIESEGQLARLAKDISKIGLIKEIEKEPETNYTNIEKRILAILREFNGKTSVDKINKLFVTVTSGGSTFNIDTYLKFLEVREKVKLDERKELCQIKDLEDLNSEFERLKKSFLNIKEEYSEFQYGYLATIKQRDVNAIIFNDCLAALEKIIKGLGDPRFLPDHEERWIRKFILFKLLMGQIDEINKLIKQFLNKFNENKEKIEVYAIKRAIEDLEEILNARPFKDEKINIKEHELINDIEGSIKSLLNKEYSKEDIKVLGLKQKDEICKFEGLYFQFKNCPVFDVKMIELAKEYDELKILVNRCKEDIAEIKEKEKELRGVMDAIEKHEIYRIRNSLLETQFSLTLLDFILKNTSI
jgi:hypothetical protein